MIINEDDKIYIVANEINLHRSTHIRIHHLKVTLGSKTFIIVEFLLMLLCLHTVLTNFSWYVDQWQSGNHFFPLQNVEISKDEMANPIIP